MILPGGKDPEDLPPVERIRYVEAMIRHEHRVLSPDYMFWGHLADHLNFIASVPEKLDQRASDRRQFNNAQDLATGYIRMMKRREEQGGK
jgi:hypothetical protein